ncbi:hypothetical protein ABZS95_43040 [Streptomyces sp. NPDC005479]|uniref:hypothetical protein n=1 Tax=unclassified Streptomyces TaxID=2593676 RepID=UPI0033B70313
MPPKLVEITYPWNSAPPKPIDKQRRCCSIKPACAFRRFVPRDVELVFCDEGYNFHIPIRPDTDDAELIKLMNADG